MTDPIFFPTPEKLRAWFLKYAATKTELWVGYYHKKSGIPTMTWSESVDQALCFGWIDGIRYNVSENSYKIRFTPRKVNSHWSAVNLKKMEALIKDGRMTQAGLGIFEQRDRKKQMLASFEQEEMKLSAQYLDLFQKDKKAWSFYENLAPSYKKGSIYWVMSAKKEETRRRRLRIFIDSCADHRKIPMLRSKDE